MVVRGSAWLAASCTSRRGTPASEGGGDEGVAERVRSDRLVDAGLAGEATHDPPGGVSVEAFAVPSEEDRSLDAFTDRQVDRAGCARCRWDGHDLAALAQHGEGAMPALEAERFDVGAECFGDSQPVDRQQRHQRVFAGRRQAGGDEQRPDLVAVQAVAWDS